MFLKTFEKWVIGVLIGLMALVVLVSTIELAVLIVRDIMEPPRFWLGIDQLFEIFGFFLMLLIGVELLETIKAYLMEHVVHSEIVLEVGLIAIARKVIILDVKEYGPMTLVGIASLILAIALAYALIRRCRIDSCLLRGASADTDPACREASSRPFNR